MTASPMPSTVAHLDALASTGADGYVILSTEVSIDGAEKWRSRSFHVSKVDEAAKLAAQWDAEGRNVWVRVSLVGEPLPIWRRGKGEETTAAVALAVDIDVAGPGHAPPAGLPYAATLAQAMTAVEDLPEPTFNIHTGGGVHLWWILSEPVTDNPVGVLTEWGYRVEEAGRLRGFKVDRPDAARVLRVCGTHRRKTGIAPNRVTLAGGTGWPADGLTRRPWKPITSYRADELLACLPEPVKPEPRPASKVVALPRGESDGPSPADYVSSLNWGDVFTPAGWTFVQMGTIDGQPVELWRRPGATSPYSAKAFPNGPAIVWSEAAGIPSGPEQKLSKFRVFAWLYFHGNESAAATAIARRMGRAA